MDSLDSTITTCSTEADTLPIESEIVIGRRCYINLLLIVIAIFSFAGSFFISFMREHQWPLLIYSVFILGFELFVHPFYYYGITNAAITEYFFGKKRRTIPWDCVIQVGVQLDRLVLGSESGVIITLKGAPTYKKTTKESSFRYYLNWRPDVLFIYAKSSALPVIEKHYGPADYKCKNDLR